MTPKLLKNIRMLIIGLVLLFVSFSYLFNHPGERNSFLPSFTTLSFKIKIFLYDLIGKDTNSLEIKNKFEKIYTELGYLVESSHCTDPELLKKIDEQQTKLQQSHSHIDQEKQFEIITEAQNLKKQIEEQCAFVPGLSPTHGGDSSSGSTEE